MNTQAIRDYVEGTTSIRNLALAVIEIAAALDALDERTRVPVVATRSPKVRVDDPPTCDCGICSEGRQGVSTIPGCYCRECRHSDTRSRGGIYCEHPIFSPSLMALSTLRPLPAGYGCVFGERREAE